MLAGLEKHMGLIVSILRWIGKAFVQDDDYKDFFMKSNSMFVICSLEGVLVNVNEAFARNTGYSRGELIGRQYMGFLHPDDQTISAERLRNMQVGMQLYDSVSRWRHKSGHYIALGWTSVRNGKLYAQANFYYP